MFVTDYPLISIGLMEYLQVYLVILDPVSDRGLLDVCDQHFHFQDFWKNSILETEFYVQECSEWYSLHLVTVFSLYDITLTVTG